MVKRIKCDSCGLELPSNLVVYYPEIDRNYCMLCEIERELSNISVELKELRKWMKKTIRKVSG